METAPPNTGAALAQFYLDFDIAPTFLTKQGVLGQAEWRHRLINGSYNIKLSGIFQQDPQVFTNPPYGAGNKDFRGALKAALENAGPIPLFHGIVNYMATNHAGYTDDTGVIMQVVNGDWKLQAR